MEGRIEVAAVTVAASSVLTRSCSSGCAETRTSSKSGEVGSLTLSLGEMRERRERVEVDHDILDRQTDHTGEPLCWFT